MPISQLIIFSCHVAVCRCIANECCFHWQLHFLHEKFNELNELYKSALPEEQQLLPWDLRATSVKQVVALYI